MLTTEINITFKAGDGGDGKVSFYKGHRRGPDGGNGGKGGDVYLVFTSNIYALNDLAKNTIIKAENGQPGMSYTKAGRGGQDLEIGLPAGTIITDTASQRVFEITNRDSRFLLCRGGWGGRGNWEYRSSTNTTPRYAQHGFPGQQKQVNINLKLIADYGLIGFPNAGKSSLLKELTAAHPKIGSYPFTTLEPNLGELNGKIIADIPGLIQGASMGKGLGIKFLKHIERVSLLFHCISCEAGVGELEKSYLTIRKELEVFNPKLLEIPEIILLTKADLKPEKGIAGCLAALKKLEKQTLPVSIHNQDSLKNLKGVIS